MAKYTVLTPIRKDGETVAAGESITLTEKEALGLLSCGAIVKPSDPKAVALIADVKKANDAAAEKTRLETEARTEAVRIAGEARDKADADAKLDGNTPGATVDPRGGAASVVLSTPGSVPVDQAGGGTSTSSAETAAGGANATGNTGGTGGTGEQGAS